MKSWQSHSIFALAGIAAGVLAMWLCNRCSHTPIEPIVIHDTISVQDSAWLAQHTKPKYVVRHDTMWLPKPTDSIAGDSTHNDSIAVEIPIMAYEYRDTFNTDTSSIELAVHFSGYNAKIDSTELKYNFIVHPQVIESEKGWGWYWGISANIGWGVCVSEGKLYTGPEASVGVNIGIGRYYKIKPRKKVKEAIENF